MKTLLRTIPLLALLLSACDHRPALTQQRKDGIVDTLVHPEKRQDPTWNDYMSREEREYTEHAMDSILNSRFGEINNIIDSIHRKL